MPKVGKKEFPYTAKGAAAAKAEAKKTGQKVIMPKLNEKKIQNMLTGKTKISPIDTSARKKQLSDFEKGQALKEAIRKKTGTYPNTAN